MKIKLSKKEAEQKLGDFFEASKLDSKDVKKIKKLAMKHNIKLGNYRKRFCKKCFSDLRNGKIRTSKLYKTIECANCKEKNKFRIS